MVLKNLLALKEARKLTNQQIADLSGVPLSTVTRIFNGQTDNPSFQTITDIVTALGGSLDEIMGLTKPEVPQETDKLILLYQETLHNRERSIRKLFACLCSVIAIVLFILIFDMLNGNIGYLRY